MATDDEDDIVTLIVDAISVEGPRYLSSSLIRIDVVEKEVASLGGSSVVAVPVLHVAVQQPIHRLG